MSHSSLRKKLKPAKKAIKRLYLTVESKLHSFSFSKAITAIKSNSNRILSYCSLHFFQLFKKRSLTRQSSYFGNHYNFYGSKKQLPCRNFSPIYIDQLYSVEAELSSLQTKKLGACTEASSSSSGKQIVPEEKVLPRKEDEEKEKEKQKEKVLYSIEDAWREVVAKSPQLRPVDDRAEEFISKFRKDMKIQKEKSILEFEEMLARGA